MTLLILALSGTTPLLPLAMSPFTFSMQLPVVSDRLAPRLGWCLGPTG
jgi:hypothetical protein